ncbi:MAG: phosphoglycerate kinase [Candidatus Liptonbacteria bacterium]|nr:phosphoglycerate kinase [Candidatus Liptonbacteria bacterium]
MISYLSKASRKSLVGTALLRLDFNTEDNWRMEAALPTIKFLLRVAEKIVIVSHRGRPSFAPTSPRLRWASKVSADKSKGKPNPSLENKKLSLRRDAVNLQKLLRKRVIFIPHNDLGETKRIIDDLPRGSIFVLENIRFWRGEVENDPKFAHELAPLADFYVNDAFAVSHRANASVTAITRFLPSYAGLEMEKEIEFLSRAVVRPRHPLVFILGGAKAADKLGVIKYFKNKADRFLLGGGPANTILWMRGMDVKKSLRDKDKKDIKEMRQLIRFPKIALPEDFVWYEGAIVDFGLKTVKKFSEIIAGARMIVWSGPPGMIDKAPYGRGTLLMAKAIVKNKHAFSVAGGGETVMFLKKYGLDKRFSFISTGGGAMVDFLAGKKLPGIEVLRRK